MACAEESINTEREKKYRNSPLQNVQGKKMLNEAQGEDRRRDRRRVSESNRQQGPDHRRPALFLQAKRQRKQPAHGGIQTVVSPEKRQSDPGPVMIHWQL